MLLFALLSESSRLTVTRGHRDRFNHRVGGSKKKIEKGIAVRFFVEVQMPLHAAAALCLIWT